MRCLTFFIRTKISHAVILLMGVLAPLLAAPWLQDSRSVSHATTPIDVPMDGDVPVSRRLLIP